MITYKTKLRVLVPDTSGLAPGLFIKDAYVGVSTTMEIGYAVALNKPIYAFSDKDEEICRKITCSNFVNTPEELLKYL